MEPVNAPAHRRHCACLKCFCGLRRLEKTLNFLRCIHVIDLVLKYGSDIKEGNWLQLHFYYIVLIGIVASVFGMGFFSAVFQVVDWSCLILRFDGNVCNWLPEVIWPRMERIWGFLLDNGFFGWLHICIDWNLQELLNCCSFLTTSTVAKQIADQHTA